MRTEELEGPGEGVGRKVGDSQALCWQLLFFSPALCLQGTAGLFTHLGSGVKGEQLKRKSYWLPCQLTHWLRWGQVTDKQHVFSERRWRPHPFPTEHMPGWEPQGPIQLPWPFQTVHVCSDFLAHAGIERITAIQYTRWHLGLMNFQPIFTACGHLKGVFSKWVLKTAVISGPLCGPSDDWGHVGLLIYLSLFSDPTQPWDLVSPPWVTKTVWGHFGISREEGHR